MTMTTLTVTVCQTRDSKPLASIDGLPGSSVDLTPGQARALAQALLQIADAAEARPMAAKHYTRKRVEFSLCQE